MLHQPHRPIRLYRHALSGHSHRVELFLSILDLPFELSDIDQSWLDRIEHLPGFVPMVKTAVGVAA